MATNIGKKRIAVIAGDGIGKETIPEGVRVLEALVAVNADLGTTTAVITHNVAIGDIAHRVVHFADGRVARIDVNETRRPASEITW